MKFGQFRTFAAVVGAAVMSMASVGAKAQLLIDGPMFCYGLSAQTYLIKRLRNAIVDPTLTLTVVVEDDDVLQSSGSQAEWQAALQSSITKWSDSIRTQLGPSGVNIPTVQIDFGSRATRPAYDIELVIHAEGETTALNVPPMFDKNNPSRPKFSAYTTSDYLSRPVIHVFPSVLGWQPPPARSDKARYRSNLQKNLLLHEAGHAWGLWDIYDRSRTSGTRPGFDACKGNVMYAPRAALGTGDKYGIRLKYLLALQVPRDGGRAAAAPAAGVGGSPGGAGYYESMDDRFWFYTDDPVLDAGGDGGGYILDGFGGVTPFGGAPGLAMAGAPYWAGWDIARALTVLPDGSGGWILDGWGGIHNFGAAPRIQEPAYWPNWDIARDLVVLAAPSGGYMGYVLDGWGGIHPFGGAPAFSQGRNQPGQYSAVMVYHAGQDSATGLMLLYDTPTPGVTSAVPTGGLVLEKNGVMTRFGLYGSPGDYHDLDPRFPVLNHALQWKKFAMTAGGSFYAVGPADPAQGLQGLVLQPVGTPDPLSVPNPWGAWDIVRDVVPSKPDCVPRTTPACLQ